MNFPKNTLILTVLVLCFYNCNAPKENVNSLASTNTLTGKIWTWDYTLYNDDSKIKPIKKDAFTLNFLEGQRFHLATDCNTVNGNYTITDERSITFGQMASTKMYCPDAQEGEFIKMIKNVESFLFDTNGNLVLNLRYDSGGIFFK